MPPSEYQEQAAIIQWAALMSNQMPGLNILFHIPNGEIRDIKTAIKLKKSGVKKGVPDLFLPCPRGNYHGLFIEMKRIGGRITKEQRQYIDILKANGYAAEVCYGFEEAKAVILNYYNLPKG